MMKILLTCLLTCLSLNASSQDSKKEKSPNPESVKVQTTEEYREGCFLPIRKFSGKTFKRESNPYSGIRGSFQSDEEEKNNLNSDERPFGGIFAIDLIFGRPTSEETIENGGFKYGQFSGNSDSTRISVGMRGINTLYGTNEGRRSFGSSGGKFLLTGARTSFEDSSGNSMDSDGFAVEAGGYAEQVSQIRQGSNFYWGHNAGYSFRHRDSGVRPVGMGPEWSAFGQVGIEAGVMISNDNGDSLRLGALSEYRPLWKEGEAIDSALLYGGMVKGTCAIEIPGYIDSSVSAYLKCFANKRSDNKAFFDAGANFKIDKRFFCEINYTNDSDRYLIPEGEEFFFISFGYGPN